MSAELQNVRYRPELCSTTGVYRLQVGDYFYIGSGATVGTRRSEHLQALRAGTHRSSKLQAAWDLFEDAEFTILQEVRPRDWAKGDDGRDRARFLEHEEIQKHFGTEFCCNQSSSAYGNTGLGDYMRAKWQDEEYRAKTIERLKARRGLEVSPECRAKMAEAKRGDRNAKSRACRLWRGEDTWEFVTGSEAANHFGVSQQTMHLWLSGQAAWPGVGRLPRNPQARTLIGLRGEYSQEA